MYSRNPLECVTLESDQSILRTTARFVYVASLLLAKYKDLTFNSVLTGDDILALFGAAIRHHNYIINRKLAYV